MLILFSINLVKFEICLISRTVRCVLILEHRGTTSSWMLLMWCSKILPLSKNKCRYVFRAGQTFLRERSAGWLGWAWLASSLIGILFMSRQNSIFLSQQSVGIVFFSPAEQALYFPSEYNMDHVNFALDCKLLKATHYNGSMFIHKVQKAVLFHVHSQSSKSSPLPK